MSPLGGMGHYVALNDDYFQRRRLSTTTTTSDDDDDNNTSSCSDAKSRAAAVGGVGPTSHGPKGSHLGVVIACAGEPGLGIDSPTMPGIGENHTHRSRGSLFRTRCEDRMLPDFTVRPDVLSDG